MSLSDLLLIFLLAVVAILVALTSPIWLLRDWLKKRREQKRGLRD